LKLNLHPAELGSVKISLEMADNKVTGRIVFDTPDAMRAFQREADSLSQAFRDGGFSDASFQMVMAGDGQNPGANQWQQAQDSRQAAFAVNFAADSYDDNSRYIEDVGLNLATWWPEAASVNVFA
jgi:flagellar hook-length control protein FliK